MVEPRRHEIELGMAESNCRHVLPKHECCRNTYPQITGFEFRVSGFEFENLKLET